LGAAEQLVLELRELLVLLSTQSKSDRLLELGTRGRIGWGSKPKISQGVQQLRRLPYHLPVVRQRTLHRLQHLRITKLEVQYESLASNKRADAKTLRSFPSSPCLHLASSSIPELEWELQLKKFKKSRMHDGPVEERLKVGYHLLSDRLKQCFHYFAAFPENSDIVFEEILFHWTGQGLVPEHYEDDPRAERVSLLTQWWEQSFIETNGPFGSDQCYLLNFKMHDVMRDLGFYLLEKDCGTSHAKQRYLYRPGRNLEQVPHEWKVISEPPESECTTILEAISLSLDTNKFETIPDYTQVRDYIRYYG
jgi:hypothetical protein